jgi:rhodanese-related sulfurtransferase
MIKQLDVMELKQKLEAKENFILVDAREPDEYKIAHIEGSKLIPLSKFTQEAVKILKPNDTIIVHCHHGGRSQRACEYLSSIGYKNIFNVVGGIESWSLKVDPKVPRY